MCVSYTGPYALPSLARLTVFLKHGDKMGRTQAGKFLLWKGRLRGTPGLDCIWWGSNSRKRGASCGKTSSRPTPASFFLVFHSGSGMRKIVFQVIQYKPFQILVESLPEKCLPQACLFSISGSERVSRYQDLNGSTNSCFCV